VPLETHHTDKDLLAQVAMGNENAFATLFHAYHQELADYIFLLTRSMPFTEEIVQDAFTKIWVHRERLAMVSNFRSYLFTISRNHTFNCLRGIAREAVHRKEWTIHFIREAENVTGDNHAERLLYYKLIDEAVAQLPPQQQKSYLLSRQKGLGHEEIASQLHLSRETVKRHISLALRAISAYVRSHAGKMIICIAAFFF
jgi:RNA polymerase sigma-70 factor (ECF subfamily)